MMTKIDWFRWGAMALMIVGLGLSGCDDGSDSQTANEPVPPVAEPDPIPDPVLEPTLSSLWAEQLSGCAINCHEPAGEVADGPDYSTPTLFHAQSVDKTIANDYPAWAAIRTGNCNEVPLIAPGEPDRSLVLASLVQSYADQLAAAENCIPAYNLHEVNRLTFAADDPFIQALVTWIERGAAND